MSIVPKDSVRFHVLLAVLVMIILSWVISTGLANYMNYLSIKSERQEMLRHPQAYPQPIPEPAFTFADFLLGRPPRSTSDMRAGVAPGQPGPRPGGGPPEPPMPRGPAAAPPPVGVAAPPFLTPMEFRWVLVRSLIALGLAAIAAVWVGRQLTRPLLELTQGAKAFNGRNFGYRIPTKGKSEFTAVATAMNEMADEVSRHIHSLEEDAERRRQFLADVAHELRSPITTIRTMAGALQDGLADEPERKDHAVSILVRTSERMLRLVQDVMELVELDLDKLPITKEDVDLRSLVASVILSCEDEAVKAGIDLRPLQDGAPIRANVDADRITQVLDNVIGNAISYAGAGAVVSAAVECADPVRITITDTGVGIPAKDLPHILDSFYRVSAARTPGENHIGLGLSIARRMIEAHGGTMAISSEQGKGTQVTILIPKSVWPGLLAAE
jgi:two-component system, OmpR family, sensor histidine kinase BaeS